MIKKKNDTTLRDILFDIDEEESHKTARLIIMALLLLGISAATIFVQLQLKTDKVFTHFYYFPVILAALWWKKRGLVVAAFFVFAIFMSHIILDIDVYGFESFIRSCMILVIALVISFLSERVCRDQRILRRSEQRHENILESFPIPTFMISRDHQVVYWNKAMEEITGAKALDAVDSKFPGTILYNEKRPSLADLLIDGKIEEIAKWYGDRWQKSRFIEGAYEAIDFFPFLGEKGKWLRFTAATLRDSKGDIIEAIETMEDITDAKFAEDALRESEQWLKTILEGFPNPIFVIDRDHTVVYWNKAIEEMSGTKAEEAIGAKGAWMPFYGVERTSLADVLVDERLDDIPRLYAGKYTKSVLIDEAYEATDFFPALGPEGKWVRFTAATLRDLKGNVRGAVETLEDITDRRQAERLLLEHAEALERSNQELEKFAYVASHDLQEPLRMVASYVQLLARRYQGKLDSEADEFIAYAVDGAKRMQTLINDLLAYSRVGTQGRDFEQTDCNIVLAYVLKNLEWVIEENNAQITVDPLPVIMADRVQMIQLFQNLVSNAIKFRSEARPEVHVSARQHEKGWMFTVSDNGIGIDDEFKQRVFEIFQRLHSREKYPGTGIGLAICKKIVERHGGRIWLESEAGRGAVFCFLIQNNKREIG